MLSSPSSSDTVLLNAYLESDGSQAVKNIVRAGRALSIEDALLCQLMQSFDTYQTDCHVNCAALEGLLVEDFLSAFGRLRSNIKEDIKREFLNDLLQEDSITNRFNLFLSLLQTYRDLFSIHQQTAAMLDVMQKKIREKVEARDQHHVQNFLASRLGQIPQVMLRLNYLQGLCAHLNKAVQQPDILALFFLAPFILSSELLAKIKMPEDNRLRGIVENLIVQKWTELKATLVANPPNWGEGTWQAAKDTYQKLETLTDSSSTDFQALLQRAQDILIVQNKQLFDLERKRNIIFRHDLNVKENFAPYLEALKTHYQWRDDFSFEEAKNNLEKQIQTLESFKAALKENKEEDFLAFLQKKVPSPRPAEQKPAQVDTLPKARSVSEEKQKPSVTAPIVSASAPEEKQKPTFRARLKEYAPFILTALAAFALSFYSTPLMLLMLVVGTGIGITLQYRAQVQKEVAKTVPVGAFPSAIATSKEEELTPPAPTHLVHPRMQALNEERALEQPNGVAPARPRPC